MYYINFELNITLIYNHTRSSLAQSFSLEMAYSACFLLNEWKRYQAMNNFIFLIVFVFVAIFSRVSMVKYNILIVKEIENWNHDSK